MGVMFLRIAPELNRFIKKPPEKGGFFSVSVEGLEPPTNGLKGHC